MTDTATIVVALIAASPALVSAYYANQAKVASLDAKSVSVANSVLIATVAEQTDGLTKALVKKEKNISFKAGAASKKDRGARP